MGMPRDVFKDQLIQFAEGVMPHFTGRTNDQYPKISQAAPKGVDGS
jgi:hypothetical protein